LHQLSLNADVLTLAVVALIPVRFEYNTDALQNGKVARLQITKVA